MCEPGLTLEAELAMVPSGFISLVNGPLRSGEGKPTNPNANEDRKSIGPSSSGREVKGGACVKCLHLNP